MGKKKILWNSDHSKLLTGFGRNSKAVLKHLYDTGKYDIVELACAPFSFNDERLEDVPWKAYGSVPEDPFIRKELSSSPELELASRYGSFYLDEVIEKEKPDFFIGVNDFWAFHDIYDKPWWNKVNCALWVTVDSLPIYKKAIENAHKIKNFWVWSKFAEVEMSGMGFDHVKTLHGAFDTSDFHPLNNKKELKKKFGLEDTFVFGFVFRNQVRKLVGTLLEGFSIYKKTIPSSKSKLLLHTSWSEGWDIGAFIKEFDINPEDVVTTHVCRSCKKFEVKPFTEEGAGCQSCGSPQGLVTPNGGIGLSEGELNEIYNLMDFYIHPVTSGGLEMPIVESLLAGVPLATSNYSCGVEFCEQDFVTKIDFSEYREIGSQFRKSQPSAKHIARIMSDVQLEDLSEKSARGREWALEQFRVESVCEEIERWIDSCDPVDYDFTSKILEYNDKYEFNSTLESDEEWAIDLVKNVFGYDETGRNETVQAIVKKLEGGEERRKIYDKSVSIAGRHNESRREGAVGNFFVDDNNVDNVCFIAPPSLQHKIIVSEFFRDLSLSENLFMVGVDIDKDFFSQFGKFVAIPKNADTNQVDWLKNLKNKKGEKRFHTLYLYSGNEIKKISNQ